jgi:Protein of unknown function (DUF2950)
MKPQAEYSMKLKTRLVAPALLLAILLVILGYAGKSAHAAAEAESQATFTTPAEAGQALRAAAQTDDDGALAHVLGPDSKAILSSGDAAEDKEAIASFMAKYDQMHRWVTMTDGSQALYIGADNYPYPIPLAQDSSSRWYFDTPAGEEEILARRIGKNELLAIDALSAMGNAQDLYFQRAHDGSPAGQYAQKILSSPGKQNGLYWEAPADQPSSPRGRLNDFPKDVIVSTPQGAAPIFDGYSFRTLTAQGNAAPGGGKSYIVDGKMTGGFAVLASPVIYGDSGIMTFMLSSEGVVYQKDLGPMTADMAASINSYNPDQGWTPVE